MCVCRKTDNNDPSGRNDLLTGRHYSVSVLLNHHSPDDGSVEPKRYSVKNILG